MKKLVEKYFSQYLIRVKESLPKAKPKISLGLDIGTAYVKLVRINNSEKKHELEKFIIEAVEGSDIKGAINRVLSQSGAETKAVNTSISGQGVIIRFVQMPKMNLADIKSSISLEADKYFPFPLEEIIMDCSILEEKSAENKVLVLVAGAKKELIEQRISLLSGLNLEVDTVYTDSIAMANIFNVLGDSVSGKEAVDISGKPRAIAVLNIGAISSSLNIMMNNIPRFTRDIFIGGTDFTKRVSNILGMDIKSAEELKIDPKDRKDEVLAACESVLNNLVAEVRLSFDYFETENNIPVGLLNLSGGGSCLTGLEQILKQNLGVEVRIWQPVSGLDIHPDVSQSDLSCNVNKLSIAIGLALI